jgi:hypothetical protein
LPRALTITDAIREVLTILGQWSSELGPRHATVPSGASVGLPEIKLLCCFFEDAMITLKKLRAEARATNSTPPPYPDTMEETRKLLEQLWKSANVAT